MTTDTYGSFEDLSEVVLSTVQRYLTHFERLELRKVTRRGQRLLQNYLVLEYDSASIETFYKHYRDADATLRLYRLQLDYIRLIYAVEGLPLAKHITHLKIVNTGRTDSTEFADIRRIFPSLRSLDVLQCRMSETIFGLPGTAGKLRIGFRAIRQRNAIKIKKLSFFDASEPFILECIKAHADSLNELVVEDFITVPSAAWAQLISRLHNIERLHFNNVHARFVQLFADHLPQSVQLKIIVIQTTPVTDVTLERVLKRWGKSLTTIGLNAANNLTQNWLQYLQHAVPNLRILRAYATPVTPTALSSYLAPSVKLRLQQLDLRYTRTVLDVAPLVQLLSELPHLKTLKLCLTSYEILTAIITHQRSLRELELLIQLENHDMSVLSNLYRLRELEALCMKFLLGPPQLLDQIANEILRLPELRAFEGEHFIIDVLEQSASSRPQLRLILGYL